MSDPEFSPEAEDDGGARKSFWEHLADLRSAIIRSSVAIGIALVACLLLDQYIVAVLEYPIHRMHMFDQDQPTVTLKIGTSKIGPYIVNRDDFKALPPGPAPHAGFRLGTMQVGNQEVTTLTLDPKFKPDDTLDIRLHNFSPTESFLVAFHTALYAAILVSSPFWIYFLGGFIVPALKTKERQVIGQWMFWGVVLALFGILLTYFVLLPVALRASVEYSNLLGFSAADWQAEEYINFACKFIMGMGVGFQFPLVVLILVKMGLITHRQLAHYRRHVIVASLVLGAILTTPEVFTQVAMAVPLYVLYEICIWIAWYWDWKKRRNGEIVEI